MEEECTPDIVGAVRAAAADGGERAGRRDRGRPVRAVGGGPSRRAGPRRRVRRLDPFYRLSFHDGSRLDVVAGAQRMAENVRAARTRRRSGSGTARPAPPARAGRPARGRRPAGSAATAPARRRTRRARRASRRAGPAARAARHRGRRAPAAARRPSRRPRRRRRSPRPSAPPRQDGERAHRRPARHGHRPVGRLEDRRERQRLHQLDAAAPRRRSSAGPARAAPRQHLRGHHRAQAAGAGRHPRSRAPPGGPPAVPGPYPPHTRPSPATPTAIAMRAADVCQDVGAGLRVPAPRAARNGIRRA